ncbi:hypothetical protein EJB10_02460 [Wolbachia endosymbiont of Brugia malayi]|uniref:hypothetical protein n=1 Tax=Wolbachia endosymbiont of Brugia malayi TaxID=80849 RepID=UPI00004C9262|nr:hypothetical protein [Wolbachia endosymbiont of Brugia malayi]AAW70673.1 Predicted protein [Wolbachia endosymbiont strain TRS of Brugia malayi]QCB61659.1 hypothetical protein EJB10_02460 [Wolbachia endosymbiont of Brugia malayi]
MEKIENPRENIAYELVNNGSKLTNENKQKILELAKKIKKEENIASILKKSGNNAKKILTITVSFNDQEEK